MSTEQTLFQTYLASLWNDGDLRVADELFAEDHIYEDSHLPGLPPGPEGVRRRFEYDRKAIPGEAIAIDWVVEAEKTTCRWLYDAVHRGDLGIYAPTGRSIVISGVHVCDYRDGRIARSWVMWDRLATFAQIDQVLASIYRDPRADGGPGDA
jgi:steroid delta-isomerase-like uncharacterized protein